MGTIGAIGTIGAMRETGCQEEHRNRKIAKEVKKKIFFRRERKEKDLHQVLAKFSAEEQASTSQGLGHSFLFSKT